MKTVLVTGATKGIGLHTVKRLVQGGEHRVVLHARDAKSGAKAIEEVASADESLVTLVTGDLADLEQVRGLATQVRERATGGHEAARPRTRPSSSGDK